MAKKTILDVLREVCDAGCSARVDRNCNRMHDPHYWVMAVGPNGGVLTGIPVEPDGGVHEGSLRELVADLADPRTWSTVEEPMPERVA
jgi:hypothetical protein